MFLMIDIGSLLINAYFQAWSIHFLDYRLLFISFLQPISEDFVSRSIRLLKTNKAFGLDKISARLLKDSVDFYSFFNKFTDKYC